VLVFHVQSRKVSAGVNDGISPSQMEKTVLKLHWCSLELISARDTSAEAFILVSDSCFVTALNGGVDAGSCTRELPVELSNRISPLRLSHKGGSLAVSFFL